MGDLEATQPLSQQSTKSGGVVATTRMSPVDQKVRGQMTIRPATVVPVFFVPGIMGSNICNKTTKKSVWNTNSTWALAKQWAFRQSDTRQRLLQFTECEVDDTGEFPGPSATVPDAATARKRGWGTTSAAFYGDFIRWLDNKLNPDIVHGGGHGSPWGEMVGKATGKDWNAQKPFVPISKEESDHAWGKFFCPVYAAGYNWLESNGESGKKIAQRVNEAIAFWNNPKNTGGIQMHCEKVILVTHSMGGLASRAVVHPNFGGIASKVLGIVHGEQPANGAAAAYHHCRSGYDGGASLVLGRNSAQVTAVFANSPGAMELLPNHQYPAGWLQARFGERKALALPKSNPYVEIYPEKVRWWRLVDPELIDPAGIYKQAKLDPWAKGYMANLLATKNFHKNLGKDYHPQTYIHYGADNKSHMAYNALVWGNPAVYGDIPRELQDWKEFSGSNPVTLRYSFFNRVDLAIREPFELSRIGEQQPGDETVPACSGEAPFTQGGAAIKQSFRLDGYEHQASYNNERVRLTTFYSICKLLQEAKEL